MKRAGARGRERARVNDETRSGERRSPSSNQQNNSTRHRHAGRRTPALIRSGFQSKKGCRFRPLRIIQYQHCLPQRLGHQHRCGGRGRGSKILRDLRMRLCIPIVGAAIPGMRGLRFLMAMLVMRTVAMVARGRHRSAGAIANEAAPHSEKLRTHYRQHAEREHELVERRAEIHRPLREHERRSCSINVLFNHPPPQQRYGAIVTCRRMKRPAPP